jgi:glycosidase
MQHDTTTAALEAKLIQLYGPVAGAKTAAAIREKLAAVPQKDTSTPLNEKTVLAIAYGDHIQKSGERPLQTLHSFLNQSLRDEISHVHILPFYPYSSDDGFSVIDYTAVDPSLGTWEDIEALTRDYGLMFDFVLNHISSQSEWFQKFLQDDPAYRDYFITEAPDNTDLPLVRRPRTSPLLTKYPTTTGDKYVWTTFSADQIDLNYQNPQVLIAMVDVVQEYIQKGAQLLRLDAVTYLWKTLGTDCANLPETHLVIEILRDILNEAAPYVQIVTETNIPHEENISYFGDGIHEAQMVYNFALPPLVLHTLHTGNAEKLSKWAATLKTPSDSTHFFNFTASHDGIGVGPVKDILQPEEIQSMIHIAAQNGGLVGYKTLADDSKAPYEINCTYYDALRLPEDTTETANKKFLVSQAIALCLKGMPGIYLASLFGSKNWHEGVESTGRRRTINREKFVIGQNFDPQSLSDPTTKRGGIFTEYIKLLQLRGAEPAFHPQADMEVLPMGPRVFAIRRSAESTHSVLALHSVSPEATTVSLPGGMYIDVANGEKITNEITLQPYQIAWLRSTPSGD